MKYLVVFSLAIAAQMATAESYSCGIQGGNSTVSSFTLRVKTHVYLVDGSRLAPESHGGFESAKFPGGVVDIQMTADPRSPGGIVRVYYPEQHLTYLCHPTYEESELESSDSEPVIEQVGWKVTSRDGNTYYNPPVIQNKSRGHIYRYTASPAAIHMGKGCRLVSRDGNVVYHPPVVRCRNGNSISQRSSSQLVPGLPF